jgi:hypothetical protein
MTTIKQFEANRRNSLKSTGPITPEGKDRSRQNAIRHGLTAETVIAAFEDSADYEAFEAAVTADYDAEMAVERELVLRLASVLWRLRRSTLIETGLFESIAANSPHNTGPRCLADCFLELSKLQTNVHGRISRYEQMLWRQARQLVNTLESLRRRNRRHFRMNSAHYPRLR